MPDKVWYLAQCFSLEKKILEKMLSKALGFIYAGENERPIRPLNFRGKSIGGLGLINPVVKAQALLLRNVYKEFINKDYDVNNPESYGGIYGCTEVLINMI